MITPQKPANEKERLEALYSYHVLDSNKETEFDNLCNLAAEICEAPMAFISLIDKERQWFKSHINFEANELPRSESFCGHAILTPQDLLVVEDARKDKRFQGNPNVTRADSPIIFYTGVPLLSTDKLPIGTLCVVDHKPKKLADFQLRALKTLAKQVEQLLELRKAKVEIERNHFTLKSQFQKLETFQQALDEAVVFAITDIEGKIIHANKRFIEISGYLEEELLGKSFKMINSSHYDESFWENVDHSLKNGKVWKGRVKYRTKNGKPYWVKSTIVPVQASENEPPSEFFHIQKDITEIVLKEQNRVNEIIYQHEKTYEGISHNLREGIAQSMAGLSFHLTAMESQLKNGKAIQADSIMALKDILKELMDDTNDLAFDIMPRSLMKEGIREVLHSFFNRLMTEYNAEIEFNDDDLKCFPIVKSAEIQIYRAIVSIYLKALERNNKLNSIFQLLNDPQIGFRLRIDQNKIENESIAEEITPTINNIAKQVRIIDGEFSVKYQNDKKSFEIQVILPKEFTRKATLTEAEVN